MFLSRVIFLCIVLVAMLESAKIPEYPQENQTVESVKFRKNLIHSSILYGILNATVDDGHMGVCGKELKALFEGVNSEELWALKVIDASASAPEAYIWGSNFWLGSRQMCNSISHPIDLTLTDAPATAALVYAKAPFPVDYRVIYLNISTTLQIDAKFNVKPILHLGLCVPESCNNYDVIKAVNSYTHAEPLNAFATYQIQPKVLDIKKPSVTWYFLLRPEFIALIVFCGVIVVLMLIQGLSSNAQSDCNGNEKKCSAGRFLDCFAFRQNMSYIFRTSTPNSISAIAGVRTIVCLWIVFFHIMYYGLHYSESASLFLANSQGLLYQVIWSAVIYVDVFFALSGFLLVYNFLSNIELQNEIQGNSFGANVALFGKHVFHRYTRLTPALLATILQTETVNQFMQTYSSFHISETRDFQCESTWWYNLLYIQNFLDMNMVCGGWTWYLACDFQYFIVFLLLLFIFVKSKSLGKLMFIVVAMTFILLSFYTLYANHFTFRFDAIFETLNHVYYKFWCRMNPYISGAFAGYVMRKIAKNDIKVKKSFVFLAWGSIAFLLPGSLTVTYWRDLPSWACSIILASGRVVMGIGTGVTIILCHLGHGGWFSTILSHSAFQHTQKLTYTAYLLNPLVIFFLAGIKEKGVQVDFVEQVMFFLAVTVITYILAVVNSLLFERPFQKFSDIFIMQRNTKPPK